MELKELTFDYSLHKVLVLYYYKNLKQYFCQLQKSQINDLITTILLCDTI